MTENVFTISISDLQQEAEERIGRGLSEEEILIAKKGLENGILTSIGFIYSTIFSEMIG
ncbi:MAG TPA: hypothetical protein VGB37_13715 [Candidatus Lokiarchaeia archaeon]